MEKWLNQEPGRCMKLREDLSVVSYEMVSSKVTRTGCGSHQGCLRTACKVGHEVFYRKCGLQRIEIRSVNC